MIRTSTSPGRGMVVTVGAATLLLAAVVATAPHIPADAGTRAIDGTGMALGVAASLALLLRALHPWAMLAAVTGLVAAYWALRYTGGPAMVAQPVALLFLGLDRDRRERYAALPATVAVVAAVLVVTRTLDLATAVSMLALNGMAVLAAEVVAQRRGRRAAQLEAVRRQQAQGVAEQQLALARDLHDGLAHALTGIAVHASLIERRALDPESREGGREIAATARAALASLTDIVKSLRAPGDAPTRPAPGLADVAALVAGLERSGQRVTLRDTGTATQPARREHAAYRLVQEALTNATRHAPGAAVCVDIDRTAGLVVRVSDDGAASGAMSSPGSGHGLVGMRERVVETGGALRFGPRPHDGFEVLARWEDT